MSVLATLAAVVTAAGLAGCGTSHAKASAAGPSRSSAGAKAGSRSMTFQLADSSSPPVVTQVPAQPIGSTPSSIPGVTLDLFVVQRAEPGAVLVVFALDANATEAHNGSQVNDYGQGLSQNDNGSGPNSDTNIINGDFPSVSGVALLDPAGLKEYQTFMADPTRDATCLCSLINPSAAKLGLAYFAAYVAAPPASVTTVSLVTQLGSIANVKLGG